MLLRAREVLKYVPSYRRINKYVCKMNKAYLRHLEDDKFEITFHYTAPSVKVNRQFNLCRNVSETVSNFLTRVSTNIDKEVTKKNKKNPQPPLKVSLTYDNNEVNGDVTCRDVFTGEKTVNLNVCDQEYSVIVNSPWVSALALPTSIMAGFLVYPTKFESLYTEKLLSDFAWYRSSDKNDWVQVGNSFIYTPSSSDVGSYLKISCIPRNNDIEGPVAETISTVKVEAGPGPCPFDVRHKFTAERVEGKVFRMVSYNILADLYCDSDHTRQVLYPYCPPYALAIDYRKQLITKELIGFNADIICLQECDRKIYCHDFKTLFDQLGYDSDLCLKGGAVAEGLACFYNSSRFRRLDSHRLVLSEEIHTNQLFSDIWAKISTNKNLSYRILDRSTALQVNVLESLDNNEILVVGNTHLYFHPDADHIRLLQGGVIITYLADVVKNLREKSGDKRVSLVLCGDFNTIPECGIYQLYTTGSVPHDHIDYRSNAEQAVREVELQQPLKLRSACGTPEFTNFTAGFAACLDYIFYEHVNLEVIQSVPFPSVEELNQNTALPSVVFPSDHISLISDLKWT